MQLKFSVPLFSIAPLSPSLRSLTVAVTTTKEAASQARLIDVYP